MALRPLKSFFPTADDVVNCDLPTLGRSLLVHLKSLEGQGSPVYQPVGGINREYFFALMERRNIGIGPLPGGEPEYGARQPEVSQALREAWNWLEKEVYLMRTPGQPVADWYSISRSGEKLLQQYAREEQWEKLGVDVVKHDLMNGGLRFVGGPLENREAAMAWVRRKESKPPKTIPKPGYMALISERRLSELRALTSQDFDFRKLIRLCEELNIAFQEECYFATAMLIRTVLDHVPPIFGKKNFDEVANNYGGKSFKGTMQHLQNAARNVADGHLHQQIRNSETLPTAQQVNCSQQLDLLLEEIVRITR